MDTGAAIPTAVAAARLSEGVQAFYDSIPPALTEAAWLLLQGWQANRVAQHTNQKQSLVRALQTRLREAGFLPGMHARPVDPHIQAVPDKAAPDRTGPSKYRLGKFGPYRSVPDWAPGGSGW